MLINVRARFLMYGYCASSTKWEVGIFDPTSLTATALLIALSDTTKKD